LLYIYYKYCLQNDKTNRKEVARLRALIAVLTQERERQTQHVRRLETRLCAPDNCVTKLSSGMFVCCFIFEYFTQKHKHNIFTATTRASHCAHELLRQCILPRAKFSELDAVYCSQYVRLMHRINAPAFPTFALIYQVIIVVIYFILFIIYFNSFSMVLGRF
jgi:hypothetical protein